MKKIIILFAVVLSACTKTEYEILPPQLEIIVTDTNKKIISGVLISLFLNQEDWEQELNPVYTGLTDNSGSIVFENLDEQIYLFRAEKEELNNNNDIVSFKTPLKSGDKKIINTKIQ